MEEILNKSQKQRYARHTALTEVGVKGQEKLLASRVLIVGAGGLGSPVLLYLAAAGVGTIGVVDFDKIELSNLQRQIIHREEGVGTAKVTSAREAISELNPEVIVETYRMRLTNNNAGELINNFDLVIDGSDNFTTRYLLNDICFFSQKPLISAALLRFEGQLSTFKPYIPGDKNPCYRCIFPSPPAPGTVPRCEQAGIFGAVAGVMGSLQATEAIKELLGIGEGLSGQLVLYNGLDGRFTKLKVKREDTCDLCGSSPTIVSLGV